MLATLQKRVRKFTAHRKYERKNWDDWVKWLRADEDDREWKSFYRIPKAVYDRPLDRIRFRIQRDEAKQIAASGEAVKPEVMLSVTLRWLAGAL